MSNYRENKGSMFRFLHSDSYYSHYDAPKYNDRKPIRENAIKIVVKIYEESRRYIHYII